MNSFRRATPDSEAVASSEDERPWPSAKSFGSLPRKENSVPGLGGTIWSTQKRDSFKMEKAAQRNAAREARLAAPNRTRSGLRAEGTPSPAASDASGALPFPIPMQPVPKAGRSMSHSQGQREVPISSNDHTVLPLGLLAEEADTESESEMGGALTHTTSHPPIGSLQRTSTFPSTYASFYGEINGREGGQADGGAQAGFRGDRRLDAAFSNLTIDHPPRRAQWQSKLGWDDVPNVNESRRHSLADIPTRRGSVAGTDSRPQIGGAAFWPDGRMYDWDGGQHTEEARNYRNSTQLLDNGHSVPNLHNANDHQQHYNLDTMKYFDKDEKGQPFDIPNMYKVPFVKLDEHERSDLGGYVPGAISNNMPWANDQRSRNNKQLFIVSFKCSRVDVFFLLENTGLDIKEGDIVIVEADRGQDLGTVQHANVSQDEARLYKKKYGEEQYKWLMMFSKNNNQSSVNPNAQIYGENRDMSNRTNLLANAPPTMQGTPRDNFSTIKAKAIKRLASAHEIRMLSEKEGNEAKAKRTCQQKVAHLHLDMEILDAEWQWDFQKLIFYYYADHYINFKELITELYRIYKTRIWLSAINPASFSQTALGQPPSGIGPGAVVEQNLTNNQAYAMMYGADPDPYGAVPPYRIGFDTYTPNYPAIPGVANSFPPIMGSIGGPFQAPYTNTSSNDPTPTVQPGIVPTGTAADYNYYYDRDSNAQTGAPNGFSHPFSSPSAPNNEFYARMVELNRTLPAGPFNIYSPFGSGLIAAPRQSQAGPSVFGGGARAFQPPIGTRPDSRDHPGQPATSNVGQGGRRRNNGFTLSPSESVMSRHLNDNTATEFVPSSASSTVGYGFNYPRDGQGASEIFGRYPI